MIEVMARGSNKATNPVPTKINAARNTNLMIFRNMGAILTWGDEGEMGNW